jgi:ketosteroid isomerase-like protein
MSITSHDASALVERLFDAMNERDLDHLEQIVADDFVRHCEATPALDIRTSRT